MTSRQQKIAKEIEVEARMFHAKLLLDNSMSGENRSQALIDHIMPFSELVGFRKLSEVLDDEYEPRGMKFENYNNIPHIPVNLVLQRTLEVLATIM